MDESRKPASQPGDHSSRAIDVHDPRILRSIDRYWGSNVRIMVVLLVIWAVAGLGCGVLFADLLNRWSLGGFPLGFWFAQQGSIVIFVLLILSYALLLNRLDATHQREIEEIQSQRDQERNGSQKPGSA